MNKDLFKIPEVEVHEIMNEKSGWPELLFRNISEPFLTVLRWDVFNLNERTFWESIADKLTTLLYHRVKFEDKIYRNEEELLEFIEKNYPKYTPTEKLNSVLEYIHGLTDFDGDTITLDIDAEIVQKEIWRRYYFANKKEFLFYIENLKNQNLISYDASKGNLVDLKVTLEGLTAILKINEQKSSRYCFVAMSFDSSLEEVYEMAILPAIQETGFIPYIVRNEHIGSEQTINDAIIAGIKKAHFTVADFTQHKQGVYFEAGYALGRGQKVIYTCRSDEIAKAHFDTRNYQHIVWDNAADLKQKLVDKITAFVID